MIQVVAAVIHRHGKYLVTQRSESSSHPFKWEFPGGKVEAGETLEEALQRELVEELKINAEIGPELMQTAFTNERGPHTIHFFLVSKFTGQPQLVVALDLEWLTAQELTTKQMMNTNMMMAGRLADATTLISTLSAGVVPGPVAVQTGDRP